MRSLVLFPVGVAATIVGISLSLSNEAAVPRGHADVSSQQAKVVRQWPSNRLRHEANIDVLTDLEPYADPDYGFSLAIPSGWHRIVVADQQQDTKDLVAVIESLDPGYAVGFESVQEDENDRFADYILVEILPGRDSGVFASDGSSRHEVLIDGRSAWYDRLEVSGASSGLTDVDLVIYQAEMSGLGYTVGLYAIGEPNREALMAAAFKAMLLTFRIERPPFQVS